MQLLRGYTGLLAKGGRIAAVSPVQALHKQKFKEVPPQADVRRIVPQLLPPATHPEATMPKPLKLSQSFLTRPRLCDYQDCRKPLQSSLMCGKCMSVAYCSKDCQVSAHHPACLPVSYRASAAQQTH